MPASERMWQQRRQTELEKVVGATIDDLTGRNAVVARACGLKPGEPYRRPRVKRRRDPWPRERLIVLVETVLARQGRGESHSTDLSGVAPWFLEDRTVLELLHRAEEHGLVTITRCGRANRYERPAAPA